MGNTEKIKEKMSDLKKKMEIIEWDKEHNHTFSKNHIYDRMKEEYTQLQKQLEQQG